ncbi:MAG: hypothetical protein Fur0019_04210 [Tibeticola sp.]
MTLITDDFGPVPERRVVSAAATSPQEEAIERALRPKPLEQIAIIGSAPARCGQAEKVEAFDAALHGGALFMDEPVGAEFACNL